VPRLSTVAVETQAIGLGSPPGGINSKNIRFQLFPRTSDVVEQSISSVDQPTTTSAIIPTTTTTTPGIAEEQTPSSSKRQLAKTDSVQNTNTGRRQSLLRSPSSKYAIPKFPISAKQTGNVTRASMPPTEQGLLSPPITPQAPSLFIKNKTLRGALGAIMPDLYFVGTACPGSNSGNGVSGNIGIGFGERTNDELSTVEENLHRLHIRIQFDDHRNDLLINIIEGSKRILMKFSMFFFSLF
jgi:hypothetical protein